MFHCRHPPDDIVIIFGKQTVYPRITRHDFTCVIQALLFRFEQFLFAANLPFDEWRALARFEIGRCFMELGNKEQALAALQEVVEKYPQHARAQDAARLAAELKK